MINFVHVIPAKAGIQLSYQFIVQVPNIDITDVCESLDSSLRWNDMPQNRTRQ